ncbi:hypothetical protein BH09MYX1_BH09MYX1_23000 [soil metagenome]
MSRFLAAAFLVSASCTPAEVPVAAPSETTPLPSLPSAVAPAQTEAPQVAPPLTVLPSGLQIEVLRAGHGALATRGRTVVVHYVGTLSDGKQFDSSRKRGTPFSFILGSGQVIKGWDQGVEGMREGESRRLTIPPDLGYGANGHPQLIQANSTLIFEVELIEVR